MEDRIPVGAEPSAFVRMNQYKNQNPYVGPSRDFENGLYNDFQLGWDHPRSQWTKDDLDARTIEMVNKARLEVYRVLKGYKGAIYQASEVRALPDADFSTGNEKYSVLSTRRSVPKVPCEQQALRWKRQIRQYLKRIC